MAKFNMELPDQVLKDFERIYGNSEAIFGGMTRAGAEVVYARVSANVPPAFHGSNIMHTMRLSRTYKTPTDDGINTQVMFDGYFYTRPNTSGKRERVPAPLVCNMFEYGSSKRKYPKHPFFRKSFNKAAIEKAMLEAQKSLSGGLLDD